MKTKIIFQKSFAAIVVTALFLTSACKKDSDSKLGNNPATSDEALEYVEDNVMGETFSTDVQNMADQIEAGVQHFKKGDPEDNNFTFMNPCATITKDTVNKITTIDFGTSFCLCNDSRYRKGIVTIKHTGGNFYLNPGAKREITFTDFHVGKDTIYKSRKVEGTHTIVNKGLNSANHLNWDISANIKITKDKDPSKYHTWISNRNREWVSGDNTPKYWKDDVFHISGSSDGANSSGKSFHAETVSGYPLERALDCPWFRSGKIELTPGGKATRTIDYAENGGNGTNGSCDPYATFSVNGKTHVITLP